MENPVTLMKTAFADSFMQPECYVGSDIEYELMQSGMDVESDKFYCRLSANGFLDCTDWHGPFDSIEECAVHLVETYADH